MKHFINIVNGLFEKSINGILYMSRLSNNILLNNNVNIYEKIDNTLFV
jgi:hypothetical protein